MTDAGKKKFLGTLGLAKRAGKIVTGTENVCSSLKDGRCSAVIAAYDVSENTRKKLCDKCTFYRTPVIFAEITQEELGASLGKTGLTAAAAVCDPSLAKAVTDAYESTKTKQ